MGWCSVTALLALLELIVSIAAVIFKKLTDNQGQQIVKRNQKLSNEWNLLNSLSWSQEGNDFSLIAYGGYTLITASILISRLTKNNQTCEKTLLFCGTIFFLIQAYLIYGTLEHISSDIQLNALILGSLTVVGAILFFIDICYRTQLKNNVSKAVQTDMNLMNTEELPRITINSPVQSTLSLFGIEGQPYSENKYLRKETINPCNGYCCTSAEKCVTPKVRQTDL